MHLVADNKGIDAALEHLNNDYDEMHSAGDEFIDDDLMQEIERTQDMIKLLKHVKQKRSPQMAVIADLIEFYKKNGWNTDALLPGDLSNVSNWGLAARDGQLCLVVFLMPVCSLPAERYRRRIEYMEHLSSKTLGRTRSGRPLLAAATDFRPVESLPLFP